MSPAGRDSGSQNAAAQRTGSAMVLVLVAVAIAFILGLTFLGTSTTATRVAHTMQNHSQARQIAESGLDVAIRYVRQTPDWRDKRASGPWVHDLNLLDGTVTIDGTFDPNPLIESIAIDDPSFEEATGELPTPPMSPPMSGTIGGWEVARTAMVISGLTVPRIGIVASADATDGNNQAFIAFDVSLEGTGTFTQSLSTELQPNRVYEATVDIAPAGVPILDTSFGIRVLAGGVVVASAEHASTLQLPALPGEEPTLPLELPIPPEEDSLFEVLDLGGGYFQCTLRFVTDDSPLPGDLSIQMFAESVGLATEIAFDNVRFQTKSFQPLQLKAVARHGHASHVVETTASAVPDVDGTTHVKILEWDDQ